MSDPDANGILVMASLPRESDVRKLLSRAVVHAQPLSTLPQQGFPERQRGAYSRIGIDEALASPRAQLLGGGVSAADRGDSTCRSKRTSSAASGRG